MTRLTGPTPPSRPGRARRPGRVRMLVAAVLALAATVSLSACGPDEVGSAAIVDGQKISVSQLQDATQGYEAVAQGVGTKEAQLRILERMILSRLIDTAAAKAGVSVTNGEVAAERDRIISSVGGRDQLVKALAQQQPPTVLAPSYVDRWTRDRLLFGKLAQRLSPGADPTSQEAGVAASNALVAAGKSIHIEVNPRYGHWNPQRGLEPEISGGLSKTVAELTQPTATPAQ
jgi:SurA-like protein